MQVFSFITILFDSDHSPRSIIPFISGEPDGTSLISFSVCPAGTPSAAEIITAVIQTEKVIAAILDI